MKRDFFKYLPSEMITNILSRLPIRSVARSKCVCKPWLDLLETDDFVDSHFARSVPTLAVAEPKKGSNWCTIFEIEDGEEEVERHDLHYNPLTRFDFPHSAAIKGSANGLLFLRKLCSEAHYVCNPITREYFEVPCPKELLRPRECVNYGFGASKISGKLKIVRIFHDPAIADEGGATGRIIPESKCHILTLGTESWRAVEAGAPLEYNHRTSCVFLNGNLHWVVSDSDSKLWISCFDLETEGFSTFSCPPLNQRIFERTIGGLSALGDCLCFCDNTGRTIGGLSALGDCLCFCDNTGEGEIVIWLMKEYGVEKSWTKEYVLNRDGHSFSIGSSDLFWPIKVFKDGDILMLWILGLFYCSSKSETVQAIDIFGSIVSSTLVTPSFRSLKSLGMENVI